jgi:hypothetical protein
LIGCACAQETIIGHRDLRGKQRSALGYVEPRRDRAPCACRYNRPVLRSAALH